MNKFIRNFSLAMLLSSGAVFGVSAAAYADDCSDAIEAVQQSQAEAELTDEDKATVMDALAEAQKQQEAGDGEACLSSLADSMTILGIE